MTKLKYFLLPWIIIFSSLAMQKPAIAAKIEIVDGYVFFIGEIVEGDAAAFKRSVKDYRDNKNGLEPIDNVFQSKFKSATITTVKLRSPGGAFQRSF